MCTVPHYNSVFTVNVIWCYLLYITCAHNSCVILLDFVSVCMCTVRQCVVFPDVNITHILFNLNLLLLPDQI